MKNHSRYDFSIFFLRKIGVCDFFCYICTVFQPHEGTNGAHILLRMAITRVCRIWKIQASSDVDQHCSNCFRIYVCLMDGTFPRKGVFL